MTHSDSGSDGGFARRTILQAAGLSGVAGLAGCMSQTVNTAATGDGADAAQTDDQEPPLPETGSPEVVDLDERGREVTLRSVHARHAAHPGSALGGPVEMPVTWAFQADDGTPSVPGPVLRATEGDDLSITLDNTDGEMPHTLHFHGVSKSWKDDGVPSTTGITVMPGEKHTYEIGADVPGTHLYHCHFNTPMHMDMGMYGILRIDPEGYEEADVEQFMTLKDWDTRLSRSYGGEDATYDIQNRRPDAFTINGRVAPYTFNPDHGSPVVVSEGDTVRLHLVNAGFMSHPMHTHNHRFRTVEKDGAEYPEVLQLPEDVVNVAPAERYTVEFEADADPGIYPIHCHKVDHVRNGGSYPGGMLTAVVYEQAMGTDVFADLMKKAGYEL